jgi:hypothetical protein
LLARSEFAPAENISASQKFCILGTKIRGAKCARGALGREGAGNQSKRAAGALMHYRRE